MVKRLLGALRAGPDPCARKAFQTCYNVLKCFSDDERLEDMMFVDVLEFIYTTGEKNNLSLAVI